MKMNDFKKNWEKLLDVFFPKFCLGCGKEGSYLCPDCLSLIDITPDRFCPFCSSPRKAPSGLCSEHRNHCLEGLDFATPFRSSLVKKVLTKFKNPPFSQELAPALSSLIIAHFHLADYPLNQKAVLLPLPQSNRNDSQPAEELAKALSSSLSLPWQANWLISSSNNSSNSFFCPQPERIKSQSILLVNDLFKESAPFEEAACLLKKKGAASVWALTVSRSLPPSPKKS